MVILQAANYALGSKSGKGPCAIRLPHNGSVCFRPNWQAYGAGSRQSAISSLFYPEDAFRYQGGERYFLICFCCHRLDCKRLHASSICRALVAGGDSKIRTAAPVVSKQIAAMPLLEKGTKEALQKRRHELIADHRGKSVFFSQAASGRPHQVGELAAEQQETHDQQNDNMPGAETEHETAFVFGGP
ncbi:MAG TPA: hypothetical protein VJ750_11890 [Rhizomicrobium sp.]|nr:hypothetical protein [Rhizomicrobium sp.]